MKEKVKKSKKSVEPAPELVVETAPELVVEVKKPHKKRAAEEVIELAPETITEPKKKKKKSEPVAEVVAEVSEKKKSKKRKLDESIDEMKPKPKKLNILAQIEDPHHSNRNLTSRQESLKGAEQPFSVPLASQKIKKIIPEVVKVDKKKRKKSAPHVIPEPQNSLPRPVWTSAGIFIEEAISPFKFTSTKYVPVSSNSSTKFGVVAFDAKKKKSQPAPAHQSGDFKTQAMLRNKNRDGSSKNIRGLLGARNTF